MNTVGDVMTRGVRSLRPQDTLEFAAQAMEELAVGSIPVCDGNRLVGMVTDRDITIRGTAQGLPPQTATLDQVLSTNVRWCFEDQPVQEAAQQMCDAQIRRLPVVDREKRLVGMISLGDLATKADAGEAAQALKDISRPSQPDRSGLSKASAEAGGGADRP